MKKRNLIARLTKIYFRTLLQIVKKLKPFCIFILKVLFWLALFSLILMLTNYSEEKIPFYIVVCAYVFTVLNFYSTKSAYKRWQESESEFYKRFCESWRPSIVSYLFVFTFGIKYFDLFQFLIFMLVPYCMEMWDRRYITNDIKQDLILEKLDKH